MEKASSRTPGVEEVPDLLYLGDPYDPTLLPKAVSFVAPWSKAEILCSGLRSPFPLGLKNTDEDVEKSGDTAKVLQLASAGTRAPYSQLLLSQSHGTVLASEVKRFPPCWLILLVLFSIITGNVCLKAFYALLMRSPFAA